MLSITFQTRLRLLGVLSLLLLAFPARAEEAVVSGGPCSNVGASTMSADMRNIMACLLDGNNKPVWKSMTSSGLPVGAIVAWPADTQPSEPDKWIECLGQTITRNDYPELFDKIGASVPDLRGLFLRGRGGNSGPLRTVQGDAVGPHTHTIYAGVQDEWDGSEIQRGRNGSGYWMSGAGRIGSDTGSVETRPINMAVRYLIRAKS